MLVGGTLAAALYAALGVGLGALVRNQVGAIVGALIYVFMLEPLIGGCYALGRRSTRSCPSTAWARVAQLARRRRRRRTTTSCSSQVRGRPAARALRRDLLAAGMLRDAPAGRHGVITLRPATDADAPARGGDRDRGRHRRDGGARLLARGPARGVGRAGVRARPRQRGRRGRRAATIDRLRPLPLRRPGGGRRPASARARARARRCSTGPSGAARERGETRLRQAVGDRATTARALLEARGFSVARSYYRLERDLGRRGGRAGLPRPRRRRARAVRDLRRRLQPYPRLRVPRRGDLDPARASTPTTWTAETSPRGRGPRASRSPAGSRTTSRTSSCSPCTPTTRARVSAARC